MSRLRRDERGGILALSAFLIPVFIVLTALVVDVGQWYSHKRQLQNRADAAAFAAGVEYAKNWKACVQNSDLTTKGNAARVIANVARQYAADPEAADYAPDPLPASLYNENVANQSKLDVVINSWNYTDDNDYSDDQPGIAADPADPDPGNPCFVHAADAITPSGGHWVDVRVKENDLPSLFGTIGLPLSRNVARARIEIHPALSGNKFLPLAVPNNVITKVQVRYFDECRDPGHTSPLSPSPIDLAPLPSADQASFVSSGGGQLWGLPSLSDPTVGDSTRTVGLTVPSYGGCGGDYLPIGTEVRLTSAPSVDINQSCAALVTAKFADCFGRRSQFRVYNDGDPENQVRLTNVRILGGCGAPGDSYFAPLPILATECRYDVSAEVNWGTRDDPPNNVSGNFTVTANGVPLTLAGWDPDSTPFTARYESSGGALIGAPGPNPVSIELDWLDDDPTHTWQGNPCLNPPGPAGNPCQYNVTEAAHQTYVATTGNSGALALVRTSQSGFVSGAPGPPLENVATGGAGGTPPSPINIAPTVGTRTVLKTGILTTLRLDDPQANQTLRCDPDYAQGQEFSAFLGGCKPWYGANKFRGNPPEPPPTWWYPATKQCPQRDAFFSYADLGGEYGVNSKLNPWRCVPTAPGMSTGQIGDFMAVATDNCSNIQTNSCQNVDCLVDGNYDGKPSPLNPLDPGWANRTNDAQGPRGTSDPRVVNLFIIPYQSLKGSTGGDPQETVPILGFASFYVFNWTGSNAGQSDQCPDRSFDHDKNPSTAPLVVPNPPRGAITGVFVETVDYESGPVDPTVICEEGQLTPCRASLTR